MLFFLLIFIAGTVWGSFLALVADRTPRGESIYQPASHCTHCHHPLKVRDLLPLLSHLFLRGRCRYCASPFGHTSFFTELISGVLAIAIVVQYGVELASSGIFLLVSLALVLSLTDLTSLLIPPRILYPTAGLLTLSLCLPHSYLTGHPFSAISIFALLACLSVIRPDSLGGGDIQLLTLWSFMLGYYPLFLIVTLGCSSALLWLGWRALRKRKTPRQIPFVPFLSFGLIIYLFFLA